MAATQALLAIIGGGNMARAIVLGALDARLMVPGEIVIVEPDAAKRDAFKSWGLRTTPDPTEALATLAPPPQHVNLQTVSLPDGLGALGGQVLLAVKPQSLPDIARDLAPLLKITPRVVISILAGTSTSRLASALGDHLPFIRVMPNTPARLRKSMTALATPGPLTKILPAQAVLAHDLFASLGEVVRIPEDLMDAYTALAGSGPAYVFSLAESMLEAAVTLGFDRITADRIVRKTLTGAAALLDDSSEPPEALRAAVTSKGGTTEAACQVLDERGIRAAFVAAITAARDRGRQLGS